MTTYVPEFPLITVVPAAMPCPDKIIPATTWPFTTVPTVNIVPVIEHPSNTAVIIAVGAPAIRLNAPIAILLPNLLLDGAGLSNVSPNVNFVPVLESAS